MQIKQLSEKIGLDEEDYRMLLDLFMETAASEIKNLTSAAEKNNLDDAREYAHSLKGSSGNMGLMEIYTLAGEIENMASQKVTEGLPAKTQQLAILLEDLKNIR